MSANGQNSLENTATYQQAEKLERERIQRERATALQELEQQRKACYQKFAVTPCLNEARDIHNEKERDLKRQEVALNDAQRKRAAAQRLRIIEERNSPQAQQALAERRGKALADSAKREQALAERLGGRQAKEVAAASKPAPSGKPRQHTSPELAPDQRPEQAAKMEKNRQQAADREKAAEMRRAQALQREAKRKKPAAASLPIPD